MVDSGTFHRLTSAEQQEYRSFSSRFIKAVLNQSKAADGIDFSEKYQLKKLNGRWCLCYQDDEQPFAGITSTSKAVIEALLADAVQNYGR